MNNFIRQSYFLLGVLATLLICAISPTIWAGVGWTLANVLLWIGWGIVCRYIRFGKPSGP